MNLSIFPILVLFSSFTVDAFSQSSVSKPETGKPMPDFTLPNVDHYESTEVSLRDFKGQWLILDFWIRGCVTCIKSFPKINTLQKRFRNEIQVVLIGINSKAAFGKGIKELYENLRKKQSLDLPIAYDSLLSDRWGISSFPHIIMVDPSGIVRAITTGQDLSEDSMQDLIDGKDPELIQKDVVKPVFDPNNVTPSSRELVYRSLLLRWSGERQYVPDMDHYDKNNIETGFRISMIPLEGLYNIAYFGKWKWIYGDSLYKTVYPHPVLEVEDTSLFNPDFIKGTGLYNYDLTLPDLKFDREKVMETMQRELFNIFGYHVSIERRSMPVWMLIAKPGAYQRLKSKGGKAGYTNNIGADGGAAGFGFRNYNASHLLQLVIRYINDYKMPYFNETGFKGNIDIEIDALMTDREEVLSALEKNGLKLVKREKEMTVLVIRDSILSLRN